MVQQRIWFLFDQASAGAMTGRIERRIDQ